MFSPTLKHMYCCTRFATLCRSVFVIFVFSFPFLVGTEFFPSSRFRTETEPRELQLLRKGNWSDKVIFSCSSFLVHWNFLNVLPVHVYLREIIAEDTELSVDDVRRNSNAWHVLKAKALRFPALTILYRRITSAESNPIVFLNVSWHVIMRTDKSIFRTHRNWAYTIFNLPALLDQANKDFCFFVLDICCRWLNWNIYWKQEKTCISFTSYHQRQVKYFRIFLGHDALVTMKVFI